MKKQLTSLYTIKLPEEYKEELLEDIENYLEKIEATRQLTSGVIIEHSLFNSIAGKLCKKSTRLTAAEILLLRTYLLNKSGIEVEIVRVLLIPINKHYNIFSHIITDNSNLKLN